jgi:hypothetical protein
MLHTVLHLTQVYGLPMEFYLPTIDWYLQKATPWVAGKTIQIQYGVQVVQLLTISLDGGTRNKLF